MAGNEPDRAIHELQVLIKAMVKDLIRGYSGKVFRRVNHFALGFALDILRD